MNTEQQIKDLMEYTEGPSPKCRDCAYVLSSEDLAGMVCYSCHLNPAIRFPVKEYSRCKHFKK